MKTKGILFVMFLFIISFFLEVSSYGVDQQTSRYIGSFVPGWHFGYGQGFWSQAIDDNLIQTAKNNGITVLHLMLPQFEHSLGVYEEAELVKLDHFLDSASKNNVLVMISFIHAYAIAIQPQDPYYDPAGIEGIMNKPKLADAFKKRIECIIDRNNTLNGKIYRNDPTILAWIICDEPISAPSNYPIRPPNITVSQLKNWLAMMSSYIKSLDQNHMVTVNITAGIDNLKNGDWLDALDVPSLDFVYAEDADMRILNYFWPTAAKDYSLRLFTLNKPVIIMLSYTSGQWNQLNICRDYPFQAQLLGGGIDSYFSVGALGVLVFSWGTDLYPFVPSYDQCYNYTASNTPISQMLKGAALKINGSINFSPQNYSLGTAGGTGSITVNASQINSFWTAITYNSWITITSGSSSTGNGTINYTISPNPGATRAGTLFIAGQIFTITQTDTVFSDLSSTDWSYNYVLAIYNHQITTGCSQSPLSYCPASNVTRGQMAAFIIRSQYGENFNYSTTPYFSDVPSTHSFFKYVQKMKDTGLTTSTGIYLVDNEVPRGQMAAFIIRTKYGETFTYTTTPYFTDVPSSHTFFKYVQKLKDVGITTSTGTYLVDDVVTRAQMAAFLSRAFLGMQ